MVKDSQLPFSKITLDDYIYDLPDKHIAQHPLAERDASRLLHYNQGFIQHNKFKNLSMLLPKHSLLVLNNTRVLPARLYFKKNTGALIEIFLLEPVEPSKEMATAMLAAGSCRWKCIIGNKKRWKEGSTIALYTTDSSSTSFTARLINNTENLVEFTFSPGSFGEAIDVTGKMPLPPYMNRAVEPEDIERYQTVFSRIKGAVAAPTASLHFTQGLLTNLIEDGHQLSEITLHVGAGTFKPIKDNNVAEHPMHNEWFEVSLETILALLKHEGPVVPIGTTACRTLESIYWLGALLCYGQPLPEVLPKDIGFIYSGKDLPSRSEALSALINHLEDRNLQSIQGSTEIFIIPSYKFNMTDALVTNFHQPGSTLILLIAALLGTNWRNLYEEALEKDYRFLSYGDSSLLVP